MEEIKTMLFEYLATHEINMGSAVPVKQPPRRLPFAKREVAEAEIKKMLEQDIIEPANTPWNSKNVLVTRPGKEPRFRLDYGGLNEVTIKD